jgi:hypothetical protein
VILTSECRALGERAITSYFKRLRFDAAGPSGARTHDLPDAKREHYHETDPTWNVTVAMYHVIMIDIVSVIMTVRHSGSTTLVSRR